MKNIVLCADDYGQAPTISGGIINLIRMGRLSATSCMVNMPNWLLAAQDLKPFVNKIDIGLHFNLTEGTPISAEFINKYGNHFFSLGQLIKKSLIRSLDQKVIYAECMAQIKAFEAATGMLPRYIDGHQHVHQFPVVRDAVLRAYATVFKQNEAYVRLVNVPLSFSSLFTDRKKFIIYAMGTAALMKALDARDIPYNTSFSGIYDFKCSKQFREYFLIFLAESKDHGLVMCHPGFPSDDTSDPIFFSRSDEYGYLASDQLLIDCEAQGVKIAPLSCFK